jgi:PKD repeat protein
MKKILFLLLFSIFVFNGTAQISYQKVFGGSGEETHSCVFQFTPDGGKIVATRSNSYNAGNYDIVATKFDVNDNIEWAKAIGTSAEDLCYFVDTVSGGGYILGGSTRTAGNPDFYLTRLDASGNLMWSKRYGGNSNEEVHAHDIIQTSSGGFMFLGMGQSFGAGAKEFMLVNTDANGNLIWSKYYGTGSDNEWGYGLLETSTGDILMVGRVNHTSGGSYAGLIKIDANGNFLWGKTYNNSGVFYRLTDIEETADGGYITTGYSGTTAAEEDILLIKVDSLGNMDWGKMIGGSGEEFTSQIELTDNGFIIPAATESYGHGSHDGLLMEFDTTGTLLWAKAYGGSGYDWLHHLRRKGNQYYIAGLSNSFGSGDGDYYFLQTDLNGYSGGCNEMIVNPTVTNLPNITNSISVDVYTSMLQATPTTVVNNVTFNSSILCVDTVCIAPIADFSFTNNLLSVNFLDNSASASGSYLWDFGDGDLSTLVNPNHTYNSPGIYTVCLTITDSCGTDSTCTSITVSNCNMPIADFSSSDILLDVSFTNTSTSSGTATYLWDFGDGNLSTQTNPSNSYAASGTYWVCLTVTDSCGTDSTCAFITIDNCVDPIAGFTFTDNGSGDIQFNNNSTSTAGATFWWDFGDGNLSTLANPDNDYTADGTYTVCLTITDSCGSDTMCQNITISGLVINEHYNNQNVTVFPNPFSDHTVIQIENGKGNYSVELYDITGRLASSVNFKNTNILTIDRHNLDAGTYLFRVVQKNGIVASGKLMVVD